MPNLSGICFGVLSLLGVLVFYFSTLDISNNLSPQGCRMSWMSPSYVQQSQFNTSWSPLAARYSLWLYREVGWDMQQANDGGRASAPVLFIPGNAGSSHQVRSIASSASRQYYSAPNTVADEFKSRPIPPLDFYAVEFNEDLSAFHGSTLESETIYTSKAIDYILSLYPGGTKIIVMGHSMGGIVATSLLPSANISAIITMSTPHILPPARFDSRVDALYERLQTVLHNDPTPIVSICGGATDMMIPSESCIIPRVDEGVFRRTVFTSALEGAWTGVGHREMVWCHQVRWRVARAALELGGASTTTSRAAVLDKWLRDGHSLPPIFEPKQSLDISRVSNPQKLPPGKRLALNEPTISTTYLLPIQQEDDAPQKLTVLVSHGTILSVGPHNTIPLRVSVFSCQSSDSTDCKPFSPNTLKLIPNPARGSTFPVPHEGSDESAGVVFFESIVPPESKHQWVAITVEGADGRGWVVADVAPQEKIVDSISTLRAAFGASSVPVPATKGLSISFSFPNLLSNSLVVYRVATQQYAMPSCSGGFAKLSPVDSLLPPLLMHTPHPTETHYYPLTNIHRRRNLLHSHLTAPFIFCAAHFASHVNFTIITSGEPDCRRELKHVDIGIDWSATLGRWASRYLHTIVSWSAGITGVVIYLAWMQADSDGGTMPSVDESLAKYNSMVFHYLAPASLLLAVVPLPESLYLGNNGTLFLAPIAPVILTISSGLVNITWALLLLFQKAIGRSASWFSGSRAEQVSVARTTIVSLSVICLAIFLFVPWQVAYLGCWLLHFHTCAVSYHRCGSFKPKAEEVQAVPLLRRSGEISSQNEARHHAQDASKVERDALNHNMHLLLFLTWLLPLTAPVLAVWVRTLLTAGYTTPFDGDHNFLAVLPFLIVVDFCSWAQPPILVKANVEKRLPLRWLFVAMAGVAFIFGSRKPYLVLDVARIATWIVLAFRIGRRYGGAAA
ncbi:hypothetical protein D9619_000541 [Psilocybe cf. subviscida]|uniref:GPI inositol-deacylase n=1 Tax=Psilocybe cf. subviscida TaxID=2480587 RepID=A0A8H5F2X5_9AGAR|nr:hypothetical protein D9619_000541 [Psilocybe cf. subviscida]